MTKLLYLIVIIYALVILFVFPKWTVDDAYIIYRYADNLANHSELTWNIGEDPVEGYTGIVLPVILACLIKVGISPVLGSHIIGVTFYLFGGFMIYLILRRLSIREVTRSIVVLLYFTAPFMFTHALSGLETTLFSSVIASCVFTLLICLENKEKQIQRESLLLLLLLLAGLIRPEGVVLAIISIIAVIFTKVKYKKKKPYPFILLSVFVYLIPGLIYFLWRWKFYGQILPNTFYVKTHSGTINVYTFKDMYRFLLTYLSGPMLICILLNVIDPDLSLKRIREKRVYSLNPQYIVVYFAITIFLLLVFIQYAQSSLLMNFSYRFFVPFFVVFLIIIGVFIDLGLYVIQWTRRDKHLRYRILKILTASLILIQILVYLGTLRREITFCSEYKQLIDEVHKPAGMFLKKNVPTSEWLIIYMDAGAIPYFSELKTVDFGKLNDEFLAKGNLSESEVIDYFYSFNAGAVVITSYDWDNIDYTPELNSIVNDPRFKQYTLVKKYKTPVRKNYFEFVFLRKDLL
ncbi:MAG: hypothetical protein B6D57_04315 [Candidatus Coatesbacteria bacterium 4484_99]|uniref:Glycosyltransferase RgtA/B/C/D-like domain-containing protein n=1 Tax=Candidatus Coatesbacteria bacterium 4484_99 TaxID=1970774 RepID=A0A1W9S1P1_9BACT|nr:MAG: hypothetical protein B6D57_04315 [Candidatus Coatesbacteria bacterium 4484_99]RLC40719.1 MAG: hypothetical protein DRH44_08210 [Candidatus Coatesbacteria bacterium]RLC40771.1 MAG: hypothetical protein DRH51_04740 [Candidatus Coatesbacteria bacterium]